MNPMTYHPGDIVVAKGIGMTNDNSNSLKRRVAALIASNEREWLVVPISSKLGSHTGEQLAPTRETGLREQSVLSPLNAQPVRDSMIVERRGRVPMDAFERLLDQVDHLI